MRKQTDLTPWQPGLLVPNAVANTGFLWCKETLERELEKGMAGGRQSMNLDQLMMLYAAINTVVAVDRILEGFCNA